MQTVYVQVTRPAHETHGMPSQLGSTLLPAAVLEVSALSDPSTRRKTSPTKAVIGGQVRASRRADHGCDSMRLWRRRECRRFRRATSLRDAHLGDLNDHQALGSVPTPLLAALEGLRLDGAIFFRAEFTENWEFESPLREMAPVIRPGAERLILFHIVAAGRCWVAAGDGGRHWAGPGDVIVLPYGDDYTMGGSEPADRVPLLHLMARPPWATMPVLTHGAGGDRTDIVCGSLHSEDPLFDPNLRRVSPGIRRPAP